MPGLKCLKNERKMPFKWHNSLLKKMAHFFFYMYETSQLYVNAVLKFGIIY